MKRLILPVILLLSNSVGAQENEAQAVRVPVQSVVLFLDGAEVSQNKEIDLLPGRTLITFAGLSPKLIAKSLQVNVGKEVNVLSVSHRINYLTEKKETVLNKQLSDSLELLQAANEQMELQRQAYETEKTMLSKNESIGGQDKGVSVAELKLAADFYRARLKEINAELYTLSRNSRKNSDIINRLYRQLSENGEVKTPYAEVSVLLNSASKASTRLELKYVVKECGWTPSYDLISEDAGKPLELNYKAKVYNNSGVEWKNVKMKLSTSDPIKSASKPSLEPWYLNFESQQYYLKGALLNNGQASIEAPEATQAWQNQSLYEVDELNKNLNLNNGDKRAQVMGERLKAPAKSNINQSEYEQVSVSELNAEFDIKKTYSIPSDARPYIVDVVSYTLNADYQYYTVPKTEREAFMLARIVGWEDLELVEGMANVYLGGTFVGQSYINTRSVEDTLSLSFGRDKRIVVSRNKIKDFNKEQSSGSNRKVTHSYEIVVKNNHKSEVQIEVEDQLPVSQDNSIVVEAVELSGADKNVLNGKLTWKMKLKPDESKKIILTYTIKYPRNKSLSIQKQKAARMRSKF